MFGDTDGKVAEDFEESPGGGLVDPLTDDIFPLQGVGVDTLQQLDAGGIDGDGGDDDGVLSPGLLAAAHHRIVAELDKGVPGYGDIRTGVGIRLGEVDVVVADPDHLAPVVAGLQGLCPVDRPTNRHIPHDKVVLRGDTPVVRIAAVIRFELLYPEKIAEGGGADDILPGDMGDAADLRLLYRRFLADKDVVCLDIGVALFIGSERSAAYERGVNSDVQPFREGDFPLCRVGAQAAERLFEGTPRAEHVVVGGQGVVPAPDQVGERARRSLPHIVLDGGDVVVDGRHRPGTRGVADFQIHL